MKIFNLVVLFCFTIVAMACNQKQTKDKNAEEAKQVEKSTCCVKQFQPVSIQENQFVINGENKVFRGLCLEDLGMLHKIGHWGEEYIRQASLWNVEIVRFPVHPVHLNDLGKEKYYAELKKGIEWAKKYGMYSIIDWHVIGNMKTEIWQDPMYETTMAETLEFWSHISEEYKNEPAVAFYELYNEPTTWSGKFGDMNWTDLMDVYKTILDTVRVHDKNKVALLGGLNWAYDNSGLKEYDPKFENVGFVTHPYPQKNEEPWAEAWDEHFGFITAKYPVFATEFGFSLKDQKGAHIPVISDEHYGDVVLDYFKQRGISHTAWVFSWHWYPTLLKDSTYTPSKGQGEYFHKIFASVEE